MENKGLAHVGVGMASGDDKGLEAIKQAVNSPLLETSLAGATDILINIKGDLAMYEQKIMNDFILDITGDDVNLIWGTDYDSQAAPDTISVTVIATGINEASQAPRPVPGRSATMTGTRAAGGFVGSQARTQGTSFGQPVYGQSLTQPGMQNMGQGVMQGQGMPMQGMPVQGNVPGYGTPIQPQAAPTPTPTPTPGTQRPVFGSAGTSAPQSRVQSSQLNIPDFLRRK